MWLDDCACGMNVELKKHVFVGMEQHRRKLGCCTVGQTHEDRQNATASYDIVIRPL